MNENKDSEKEASFQNRLLRVIFRWVFIFAVSALVLYGAFWAATHPNNRITLIFVVGVIVVILLARVTGWLKLFDRFQKQVGNSQSQIKPSMLEVTEQNVSDGEDPNIALQSLLTDIDSSMNFNQTWKDTIVEKTKKIRLSIPIKFYRNDREILGKYCRNLEEKWALLENTQSEKSYSDLIRVLDDLNRWITTH
jgi:hypothetical protein